MVRPAFGQLVLILLTGLYVLNVCYEFEGTGQPLGSITFISRPLAGEDAVANKGNGGNRFAATWLSKMPILVPVNYIRGIDVQKYDFERGENSYLLGVWKKGGWWYYYIVAAAVKIPLGIWCLLVLAVFSYRRLTTSMRKNGIQYRDELVLLLPSIAVILLVSSQTGFNKYFRYMLPAMPAIFVFTSRIFDVADSSCMQWIRTALVAWAACSSAMIYPHSLSYFNEAAGGPVGGPRFLVDANIDWGQDMFRLKDWIDQHPDAQPMNVGGVGFVNAKDIGIEAGSVPRMTESVRRQQHSSGGTSGFALEPGWYAISIAAIHGPSGEYSYFQTMKPAALVGYSFYIYHVELE